MSKRKKEVAIYTEYITLGQLLKFSDVIFEGGDAKTFLLENEVLVNGEDEKRRGRKIRPGDAVELPDMTISVKRQ